MRRHLFSFVLIALWLAGCTVPLGPAPAPGIAWGPGSFDSNGERIYFTATNDRGERIPYQGGPSLGGMMMGSYLACASCHGPDARGGVHMMHMEAMDAPDIRWSALAAHEEHEEAEEENQHEGQHEEDAGYTMEAFRQAVIEGKHPTGEPLSNDMPRWNMDEQDLADLAAYLQSLN